MNDTLSLTYLGHSTTLVELDGMRLITDPVFSHRIFHLHRTHPPVEFSTIRHVDAVLISHLHFDHLDVASLRLFPCDTKFFVPVGASGLMKRFGFKNCQELHVGEAFKVGPVEGQAVMADHTSSRHPFGMEATAIGYVFHGGARIYFPGDTRLFPQMAAIGEDLDIVLMPVWGWGPHLGKMHMTPRQAAEALTLLKPRMAVPIHWGTYLPTGMGWMDPAFHRTPPLDFSRHAQELAPDVRVQILKPGETMEFTKQAM